MSAVLEADVNTETKPFDPSWRDESSEPPTDEIELPARGPEVAPAARDAATRPYELGGSWDDSDRGGAAGHGGGVTGRGGDAPTLVMPPSAPASAFGPAHPRSAAPTAAQAPARAAAPPSPSGWAAPTPVSPGVSRVPVAPSAVTPVGAVPRPVGPGVLARLGAFVLAPALVVPGVALTSYALVLALVDGVGTALGATVAELPLAALRILLLVAGVLLLAFGALTSRLSGLGVGVTGSALAVAGLVTLIWPGLVGDWLLAQPALAGAGGGGAIGSAVAALAATVLGTVALAVGAMLLAVAGAVHGARQAGWDRGAGR